MAVFKQNELYSRDDYIKGLTNTCYFFQLLLFSFCPYPSDQCSRPYFLQHNKASITYFRISAISMWKNMADICSQL